MGAILIDAVIDELPLGSGPGDVDRVVLVLVPTLVLWLPTVRRRPVLYFGHLFGLPRVEDEVILLNRGQVILVRLVVVIISRIASPTLRDAVARLEHQPTQTERAARVTMDTVAYGTRTGADKTPAALPPAYIETENVRVQCYQRLQGIHSEKDLILFAEEIRDRFGAPPPAVEMLLAVNTIRVLAEERGFREVSVHKRRVMLKVNGTTHSTPTGKLPRLTSNHAQTQLQELIRLLREIPLPVTT